MEESEILKIHEDLFSILEEENAKRKDFHFYPRKINNQNRLEKGYWFIGNNRYLIVGLADGNDHREKVHNIGFTVWMNKKTKENPNPTPTCTLKFSASNDERKAPFLRDLAKKLSLKQDGNNPNKWHKLYIDKKDNNIPYKEAIIKCINEDLPIIHEAILSEQNKSGITLISKENFNKYFGAIQNHRATKKLK